MNEKPNILIVDDAPTNIRVVNAILKNDYNLFAATSGPDTLDILAGINLDMVLLDANMPDLDGYEVLRILRSSEKTRELPVIVITGDNNAYSELDALRAGASDFMTKPVNPELLRLKVATHLEHFQQRKKQC